MEHNIESQAKNQPKSVTFDEGARITKKGETGTYKILFKNGSEVILEAVRLSWIISGSTKTPRFQARYDGKYTNYFDVAFGNNRGQIDSNDILGIFRMGEFGDGVWPSKSP